ncbi:MAG: hypothetical protein JRG89_15470, partial [Deltaproteobacteria bacterium]|nr:hypothetical protein [Deltaproteobacteria bacterium]
MTLQRLLTVHPAVAVLFALASSLSIAVTSTSAMAQSAVGHVVSVEGEAYAQAPGEEARRLECDSPIYRHDLITTMANPGLAIMSGDAYVRLAGNSTLRFGTLNSGPPDLDLQTGQVRMIDMGDGTRTGRIATPGLVLADARSNSEAIVFAEKIWTVSMICSRDDALEVERNGKPGERMVSAPGQCTISKPKEPLFTAAASHDPLELLARAQCGPLDLQLGVADRFAPGDLAGLLPAVGAGPPGLPPPVAPRMSPALPGCTVGGACQENLQFIPSAPPIGPVGP